MQNADTIALVGNAPRRAALWIAGFLASALLYAYVGFCSPGFDDEINNIDLIQNLGTWKTAAVMEQEDVHPPGGYVINGLLYDTFHDWHIARVLSGLAYVISALMFSRFIARKSGERSGLLSFLFMTVAPASLIWCTSIRWYAYFIPLLMWGLSIPKNTTHWLTRSKAAFAWLLMAYISYAALVILPCIIFWWKRHSKLSWLEYIRSSFASWLLAAIAFAPQFYIFLTVHSRHAEGQTSGIVKSMMGVAISLFSNQGLFPLSYPGYMSAATWATLYLAIGVVSIRRRYDFTSAFAFMLATFCLVISGLAGKFRNLVLVTPFQSAAVASNADSGNGILLIIVTAIAATLNGMGVLNVLQHRDTTKNSWNLPTEATVQALEKMSKACATTPTIYTFDPVIGHIASEIQPAWQIMDSHARFPRQVDPTDCSIIVLSYKGAMKAGDFESFNDTVQKTIQQAHETVVLGNDPNAARKRSLDPYYPDHQMVIYSVPHNLQHAALDKWIGVQNPKLQIISH